ncbi:MAG: glyoxalase/bleomycin resistance protein/dioxygenase superfamily protein 23 [Aeromicrobium sp.]|jgi:hypothetical protein|uniref:glyoxalase superfamily protein n=1 Tax=Aeromicrobium sp. TaxID=1871063 RepID=UPI00261A24A4|nr:glyoxalase superfamily protein [Aeromicrobium sp.]MCW2824644.1 glyoxalase/bleomycin resistance protein/dioxygenase superfamily protein 23 [Aeromicrobium sp.]
MLSFEGAIPMLRILDERLATEFSVDVLGFTWDWENPLEPSSPLYAQVSRGDLRTT